MPDQPALYPPRFPPCRHGAQAEIEVHMVDAGLGGPFSKTVRGRYDLRYRCPTPITCAKAAVDAMEDALATEG